MDFDVDIDARLEILDEIEEEENASSLASIQKANEETSKSCTARLLRELSNDGDSPNERPTKRRKIVVTESPTPLADGRSGHFLKRRIPFSGDYVPITFADGRRFYLDVEDEDSGKTNSRLLLQGPKNHRRLLPDDLTKLVRTAEQLKFQRALASLDASSASPVDNQMWVKKYEPRTYLDLISAEHVNRQLLCWLKAWDSSVFGVEPRDPRPTVGQNLVEGVNSHPPHPGFNRQEGELTIAMLDHKDGKRPQYRIVLLCGPPGLGKTTLAHLLAKHAGYQVIETNASDDRTPGAMRERLESVVSSQSSLNATAGEVAALKPACLVVDEVDGALPAAVEVLAEAAAAPLTHERKRFKKPIPVVLRRPVICICNDLYAPALRPLRAPGASCYILRLPPIDSNRLVERLDWIACKEDVHVDKRFLSTLVETSGRDVRSCLNVLQFAKATQLHHKRPPTTEELVAGLEGAMQKDTQHSLFSAWQAVFTIPSPHVLTRRINQISHNRTATTSGTSSSDTTLHARVQITLEICNSTGETSGLVSGLFENYLNRKMNDASLQKARHASELLVDADRWLQRVQASQDCELLRYPGLLLPAWFHLSFANTTRPPIAAAASSAAANSNDMSLRWPVALTETTAGANRTRAVVYSLVENQWRAGGPSGALTSLRLLTHRQFLLDAASYLRQLVVAMSTPLRAVNPQLYSARERHHLARLVGLMVVAGLDWVPQQALDTGEATYRLEPPLDTISQFASSLHRASDLSGLSYSTKQMLARELARERMRRSESASSPTEAAAVAEEAKTPGTRRKATARLPDSFMAARLGPTAAPVVIDAPVEKKIRRDFFGRPIVEKSEKKAEKREEPEPEVHCPINRSIWFKFKEGHSTAVRRPCSIKRFLK